MKKIICFLFLVGVNVASSLLYAATADGIENFTVCVNDDNPPFSSSTKKESNVDIQVLELIAQKISKKLKIEWVTVSNRGGLGKALRTSIGQGLCDAFVGLPTDNAFSEDLKEKNLIISIPYLKVGYFLIFKKQLSIEKNKFDSSKKIGTVTRTSGDFFIHRNFSQNRYPHNTYGELINSLNRGAIDYALVWSPAIADYLEKIPLEQYYVLDYEPNNVTMNMSFGIAVKSNQSTLMKKINLAIESLLKDGSLNLIVNQSKLPFVKLP